MTRACYWLLRRYLAPELSSHVIGDLVEQRNRGALWIVRETISALWYLRARPKPGDSLVTRFITDLRFAARVLRRAPTYAFAVIITLGLAIGATTAIFSIVEPVLLNPLPYPNADRLAFVWERNRDGTRDNIGFATYRDLVAASKTIEYAAAVGGWAPTISSPGTAERVAGDRVSWTYFRTLGLKPALGRDFLAEEDQPGRNQVVILSHRLWQRHFNGDSSVVGRAISVGGAPMTVLGVMPASLDNVISPDVQIWRALGFANQPFACRTCHSLRMIARIRPGVTMAAAETELAAIHNRLERQYPTEYASVGASVVSVQGEMTREFKPALLALAGAVIIMLLIAVANVISLQLARAVRREDEFAVRTALGAGRSRLAGQLFVEGLVLAILGGAFGVIVARLTLPVLVARLPDQLPRLSAIHLNFAALGVVGAIVMGLSVVMGFAPVGRRSYDLATALRSGRRISGTGNHFVRATLVVTEVALAVVLLMSAGLVARSLVRLLSVDPGFDTTHLLTVEINSSGPQFATAAPVYAHHDRVRDAVRTLPGVTDVAVANQLPLSGQVDMYGVLDPENMPANPELAPNADRYAVSAEYLKLMRIPLLRGRTFTETDGADTTHLVALVSTALAEQMWPGQDAIGKRIRLGGPKGLDRTVIGVVGNIRHRGLDATVMRQFYVPERQWGFAENSENLLVRTSGDPVALIAAVRRAVTAIDPTQPMTWAVTMEQMISRSTAQRRLALVLFGAFACAALLLAMAGIYGVLAGSVAERTREIGVRSALGATPANIIALIVGQGGRMMAVGIVLGVAGSFATTRFLRTLLFGIGPGDPATLTGVVVLLSATTIAACLIPARRASQVDPSRALRSD